MEQASSEDRRDGLVATGLLATAAVIWAAPPRISIVGSAPATLPVTRLACLSVTVCLDHKVSNTQLWMGRIAGRYSFWVNTPSPARVGRQ